MTFQPFYVIVVLVLGVLIFGKNLPTVAKQISSALLEFRKGVNEWKEERHRSPGERVSKGTMEEEIVERFESLGTKFEPPSESG